jgi:hypothetical protein
MNPALSDGTDHRLSASPLSWSATTQTNDPIGKTLSARHRDGFSIQNVQTYMVLIGGHRNDESIVARALVILQPFKLITLNTECRSTVKRSHELPDFSKD